MLRVLIIAAENEQLVELSSKLGARGLACTLASNGEEAAEKVAERAPDLVLVAMDGLPADLGAWQLARMIKQERHLPVIARLSREALDSLDSGPDVDDFIVEPWDVAEVAARARRVLWRRNKIDGRELIECGELVIDLAKCKVSLCGKLVSLTFREYELLRFLVSNKGRVFTREALLNKVWGYDYYGGDRTVDVHIRRLRSKIQDSNDTFVETGRDIGYKFREET